MLSIAPISAFSDNYIWLITAPDVAGNQAFVVDPGDADPVIAYLEQHQLELSGMLITHHHPDHVGGIDKLMAHAATDPVIYGPHNPQIGQVTNPLSEGEQADVLGTPFTVIEVPGHTLDHIAFYSDNGATPILFCGDTLFAGGCGRIFEGTAPQMHASLAKLAELPEDTSFYCAHEYTLSNLHFAHAVEPQSDALNQYIQHCEALRQQNRPTVPSTIANELAVNPFLRSAQPSVKQAAERYAESPLPDPVEVFRVTREWKDNF